MMHRENHVSRVSTRPFKKLLNWWKYFVFSHFYWFLSFFPPQVFPGVFFKARTLLSPPRVFTASRALRQMSGSDPHRPRGDGVQPQGGTDRDPAPYGWLTTRFETIYTDTVNNTTHYENMYIQIIDVNIITILWLVAPTAPPRFCDIFVTLWDSGTWK